jgi:hypothetical protein
MEDYGHFAVYKQGQNRFMALQKIVGDYFEKIKNVYGPEHINDLNFRERVTYLSENAHTNPKHLEYARFQEMPPTATELKAAAKVRDLRAEFLVKKLNLPEEYVTPGLLGMVRELATYDPVTLGVDRALDAPGTKYLIKRAQALDIHPEEADSLRILQQESRAAAKYEVFEKDGWLEKQRETIKKIEDPNEKEIFTRYIEDIVGDITSRQRARWHRMESIAKFLAPKLGIKLTKEKLNAFRNLFYKSMISGALGFRPVPILKQGVQLLTNSGPFSKEYLFKGATAAMDKGNRDYARTVANIKELSRHEINLELARAFGPGGAGKVMRMLNKFADTSLYAFAKADEWNRLVSFWTGKLMLSDAIEDFWAGKIDRLKFEKRIKYRWFDKRPEFQSQITELLARKGDREFLRKVSDEYGQQHMIDVNYAYSRGNAPLISRNHPLLAQFATWPANFGALLARHIEYANKTHDWSGVASLVGMLTGTYAVGEATGYDFRSLMGFSSVIYTGGPTLTVGMDAARVVKNWFYGVDDSNISNEKFLRDIDIFLPAGLALRQFVTGMSEEDLLKAVGLRKFLPKEE